MKLFTILSAAAVTFYPRSHAKRKDNYADVLHQNMQLIGQIIMTLITKTLKYGPEHIKRCK